MSGDITILEEDAEDFKPTDDEIEEYAQFIGIDPVTEPHLLWLAREGLNARLPENWRACLDSDHNVFYQNVLTDECIWEHPCDESYKSMVEEERRKSNVPNARDGLHKSHDDEQNTEKEGEKHGRGFRTSDITFSGTADKKDCAEEANKTMTRGEEELDTWKQRILRCVIL
ncbi:hypothetical protein ScPMuIL_003423 [Solemya velum]